MDKYQDLLNALGNIDDVEYLFSTGRAGSRYAAHKGGSSTGFRTPSDRPQTEPPSLQGKSNKTLFVSRDAADKLQGLLNTEAIGTKLMPVITDGKLTAVNVISTANVNLPPYRTNPNAPISIPARSYKEGQVLATIPASMVPEVGLHPIEIGGRGFESPVGTRAVSEGRLHIGTNITDVQRPSRLGKAGIAAALAGGAGAASAGDFRKAAADVAESFMPLGLTPLPLQPGTLTPEQRAAQEDATRRMQAQQGAFPSREAPAREQERVARAKAQAMLRAVPMPDEYRKGGRMRMI